MKKIKEEILTPAKIVELNFKGLDSLIEDKDLLNFYKALMETCLEGYGEICLSSFKSELREKMPDEKVIHFAGKDIYDIDLVDLGEQKAKVIQLANAFRRGAGWYRDKMNEILK